MRYLIFLLVGILAFAWAPGPVGAQSFPVGVGLPSLGGPFGGGSCGTACDPKTGGGLAFEIGYLATNRSVVTELNYQDNPLSGDLLSLRRQFPVQGLWLALCARGSLSEQVGVYARGSWLVPSRRESDEQYQLVNNAVLFPAGSTWSTRPQWYTIEGGGLFSFSPFSLIGGFRFDSFQATFDRSGTFFNIGGLAGDDADLTVTSYIPYVGFLAQQGSTVKVGIIGFPYVFGDVKYRETYGGAVGRDQYSGNFRTAYFLEAFAEYGMNLLGGYVGIFGTWTYLHAQADVDAKFTQIGFNFPTQTFEFNFDRQNWIFGGKFGINFTSPL